MKITNAKILGGGAALTAAFLVGIALAPSLISPAAAQILGGPTARTTEEIRGPGHGPFETAARYIGITVDQLRTEMGTTKSLADVAVAHGKTRDGLIKALTDAQQQRMADLVDHKGVPQRPGPGGPGGPGHGGPGFGVRVEPFQAAAKFLGIGEQDLRTQLRSGKSLAQVAQAAGKSKDALVQAIVADETTKIDQAVKDGKLTADQATKIKSDLTQRVTDLVDHVGGTGPGFGFHR